ncbi:MAG: imidazolonepropionase [Deltaproteobacteria bacterium]|nr:imidazolonepropionase [Deltaproteobacteria bacterium]
MRTLFRGIAELVQPHMRAGRSLTPVDVTRDAALLVEDGRVRWAGPAAEAPAAGQVEDLRGRVVVPGLVDSHTHVVFAGERIDEMAERARGATYEHIAAAGGGIRRSVAQLRAASVEQIVAESRPRLAQMLAHGTTTCEVKSGYGLSPELELKHLRAMAALAAHTPLSMVTTVLAHTLPADAGPQRTPYIDRFINEVLRPAAAAGLARYCDVFVETGALTPDEARHIAAAAKTAGLALKLHVDQLHDGGGAALAAELGALSADHLEHTPAASHAALAQAGVVATILPGCRAFLGKGPWPDGRALRNAGCEVAVATDCNPGTSMITDLALCGTLAATSCGLTLEESLWAITAGGARALGLTDRGTLRPGERADFVVLDHSDWRALFYRPGNAPIASVFIAGNPTPA